MIAVVGEYAWRHPLAGNYQFFGAIAGNIGPYGAGYHAYIGNVGILCFCHVSKMAVPIVYIQVARGGNAVVTGRTSATYKQVEVTIFIKIVRNGYGCVHTVIGKSSGIQTKIAFTIILQQAVLHFATVKWVAVD